MLLRGRAARATPTGAVAHAAARGVVPRRYASSSATPGVPFREWWRAGVSLQALGGVTLGAMVVWQAGQQAALERKLEQLERSLAVEQPKLHAAYAAAATEATVHQHSVFQRIGETMMGEGHKFGDLVCVLTLFPLACVAVGAASTRASTIMMAKRSADVAKRRALGSEGAELKAVVQRAAPTACVPPSPTSLCQRFKSVVYMCSWGLCVRSVVAESAVAAPMLAAAEAVRAEAVTVETSVAKWHSTVINPQKSVLKMGGKERRKSLAMRRSLTKGALGAPSLMHSRRAFARQRNTALPVTLQHRTPGPALPLAPHGLQMSKVSFENGEHDTLMAHVENEHKELQQHLEAMIEPTVKPDSEVRAGTAHQPSSPYTNTIACFSKCARSAINVAVCGESC